ncbi:uncharacterized protein LOC124371053 [Homalodisca vitripennis]|uniref:uncharacterized protein LOC124371053 n=1 Tax=Homalodisca vitripennis TaxID=197043 RepID=UPI001EEC40AB|nr:uncharacterized protein LOC124371053 [Homalodisca vitripennis]
MPLPPSPSPPRAAARRLPLQTMPLPQPRRLPRISIAPAQAPSTSRSSGGSNVATVAPTLSTSRSSAGPNVDSTQPSTSTGRTGACRRPPTAASGVDVARQRLRELVLDHFLQVFVSPAHAPVACTVGALVAMSTLRAELRDMLWLVDHLLDETPRDQSLVIAYALWREVRSSLEGLCSSASARAWSRRPRGIPTTSTLRNRNRRPRLGTFAAVSVWTDCRR